MAGYFPAGNTGYPAGKHIYAGWHNVNRDSTDLSIQFIEKAGE